MSWIDMCRLRRMGLSPEEIRCALLCQGPWMESRSIPVKKPEAPVRRVA